MSKTHVCPDCGRRFDCDDAATDSDIAILRRQVVAQGQAIEALRAEIARDWQRHNGQHGALGKQVDGLIIDKLREIAPNTVARVVGKGDCRP